MHDKHVRRFNNIVDMYTWRIGSGYIYDGYLLAED